MKKIIFPLILSLLTFSIFSQNLQDNLEVENVQESFIEKSLIEDGVYENGNKFLVFEENDILQGKNKEKIRLRTDFFNSLQDSLQAVLYLPKDCYVLHCAFGHC